MIAVTDHAEGCCAAGASEAGSAAGRNPRGTGRGVKGRRHGTAGRREGQSGLVEASKAVGVKRSQVELIGGRPVGTRSF